MTDEQFEDWMRHQGWQGCNLVNPLCPEDLCVRSASHNGKHQLMTDIEPSTHHSLIRRCAALKGATARELIAEGQARADEYNAGR